MTGESQSGSGPAYKEAIHDGEGGSDDTLATSSDAQSAQATVTEERLSPQRKPVYIDPHHESDTTVRCLIFFLIRMRMFRAWNLTSALVAVQKAFHWGTGLASKRRLHLCNFTSLLFLLLVLIVFSARCLPS